MKFILTISILFIFNYAFGQTFFAKSFDFNRDTAEGNFFSVFLNDTFYCSAGYVRNGKYGMNLIKVDTSGHESLIYTKKNIATRIMYGIVSFQEKIFTIAHNYKENGKYEDSITLIKYNPLYGSIQLKTIPTYVDTFEVTEGLFVLNNKIYFFQQQKDRYNKNIHITEINTDLEILREIDIKLPYKGYLHSMYHFNDSFYFGLFMHDIKPGSEYERWPAVMKFDTSFNQKWYKELPKMYKGIPNGFSINMSLLKNKNIAVTTYSSKENLEYFTFPDIPTIYVIDTSCNIIWEKKFRNKAESNFLRVFTLANGDILITGNYISVSLETLMGWLIRLGPDGDIIWDRKYTDSISLATRSAELFSSHELPSGNLISFGMAGRFVIDETIQDSTIKSKTWMIKIGPNGCPGYNCDTSVIDYVLSTLIFDIPKTIPITIFPIPAKNYLQIRKNDDALIWTDYIIYNSFGEKVIHGKNSLDETIEVKVDNLIPGNYIISFYSKHKLLGSLKWIKL
ncbi:MAG: hypothetical protein J5I59_08320 [Saprospiraceae bacterium]|nr:hypothetical protein [Saprospiraceae bacterium]